MIREIVPFFFTIRLFVIKATFLIFGLVTVLWISGGLYGSFYYAYIPLQTYLLPVKFTFDPCPIDNAGLGMDKDRCSFLHATVDFPLDKQVSNEHYLLPGNVYEISLDLELPSDDINRNVGMFMTCINLKTFDDIEISQNCASGVLPHRTSVSRGLRSLIPFYNYGGSELVSIEFFDAFQDDPKAAAAKAQLQIQSRHLGVSKAWLRCHVQFKGMRYLMYHYSITSGVIGITFISIFIFSILFMLMGKMLDPVIVSDFNSTTKQTDQNVLRRLEKCPNFSKLVDKVKKSNDFDKGCNLHED